MAALCPTGITVARRFDVLARRAGVPQPAFALLSNGRGDQAGRDGTGPASYLQTAAPSTSYKATGPDQNSLTSEDFQQQNIEALKIALLTAVAGLDRGLAATARDVQRVEAILSQLQACQEPVILSWAPPGASTLDQLQGNWRLLFTTGFTSGSLGGRRPGPPAGLVPATLGQVYQRIDATQARLDNIVEFLLPSPMALIDPHAETPMLRLTLGHEYEVQGAQTVQIVFESTSAALTGSALFSSLPNLEVPQLPDFLKPPRGIRSATFDVLYLDNTMRATRGDQGELRLYVKAA